MWGTDTTKKARARKAVTATLLSVLLFYQLVSFGVFLPRPVQAQATVLVAESQPDVRKGVLDFILQFVRGVLTTAVFNALNRVAQKVAYDTAVWIASGGSGEEALVFQEGFGNYLKNTALDGVADIIGGLSGPWEDLGFNLCSPSLPTISAKIQLGIANTYQPQPPKCTWQQLRNNYRAFSDSVTSGEFLQGVGDMFEFGGSDLSAAFQIGAKTEEIRLGKERDALLERLEGGGFKSKTDPITGQIETPAAVVGEKTQDALKKGDKAEEASIFGVFANTDALIAAGINVAGIFVNTLASQLLERVFTGLFDFPAPTPRDLFSLEGSEPRGRAAARQVYADLLTPRVLEISGFNFMNELAACPQIGQRRSWNCVIDGGFVAALSQGGELVTVREALERGYLRADWPLIPPQDAAKNQDPFCYTSAYCYGNLLKLRRARVIPIGWELAAASSENTMANPVRLGEVVDGFNDCDPVTGGVTSEHPWCHLIDPNWILKIPNTQCRMRVTGATLISYEGATRAEECVDTPSCIAEEKDGSCKSGYGYCTRERNIWRFPGDSCPEQFASCMMATERDGEEKSFLLNTVTFDGCTTANAGCSWYAATKGGSGEWVATSTRRYFDRDVVSCDTRDAGCAALLPNAPGLTRENLLLNSSFEESVGADPVLPEDWTQYLTLPSYDRGGAESFHGTDAIRTSGGLRQEVTFDPGKTYSISVSARQATPGGSNEVEITPLLFTGIDQATLTTNCTVSGGFLLLRFTPGDTYSRAECSFTMPSTLAGGASNLRATFQVSRRPIGSGEVWIDAVQLNEGTSAGPYVETAGYDVSVQPRYLRRAPDYLHCEQNPTSSGCASYAAACFPDEVGCERYSPTSGDPAIPAIATPEFECPSACAGYADFRQEPTNFESAKYPVYLVPSAARSCDASSAGCDEFTNEDTEERETFTFLRACIKSPSSDEATYYTWVGSETTGFQLEAHRLKKGTPIIFDWDSDPGTPDASEPGSEPPVYVAGFTDYGRCTAAVYALPPGDPNFDADCRQFYDVAGEISYRLRAKTIIATSDCHPYRASESTASDCAGSGGSWDTARGECTYLGFPGESTRCQASAKSCRAYTGSAGRNVRVMFADGFEGGLAGWEGGALSTESTSAGGKSLKVTSGGAFTKDVSPQSTAAVRNGRTYLLTFWAKGTGSPVVKFTSEQGDQSNYFTDADSASARSTVTLTPAWQFFSVGPVRVTWEPDAHDPASDTVFERLQFENFGTDAFFDNITLREVAENLYLLKDSTTVPSVCDQTREGAPLPQAMLGCTEYRDRAGATRYYTGFDHICRDAAVGCKSFIDTFGTPETTATAYCANPPCAASAPDTTTIPADAVVFLVDDPAKACAADKVGCERVALPVSGTCILAAACADTACDCRVDTNGSGSITTTGATADEIVCQVEQGKRMCTYKIPAYVAPTFTGSVVKQISGGTCTNAAACGSVTGCDCRIDEKAVCSVRLGATNCAFSGITYEETVVRNDPSSYDRTLCAEAQVGCEEWTRDDAGISYFKAPEGQTCEYKENIDVPNGKRSGWFRSGFSVPVPCDPQYVVGGVFAGIWRNADTNYRGWVGSCGAQFSGCTEFRDPLDVSTQYPNGRSYFALKNDRLNQGNDCNGQVSDREGCILFQDTSLPLLGVASSTFHAGATVLKSREADFALVSPVDCAKTPLAAECQKQCKGTPATGATAGCVLITSGLLGSSTTVCYNGVGCNSAADCGGAYPDCVATPFTGNNANTVLQVQRDRVCGEWLACRSSYSAWDASAGRFREVCDQVGLCVKYQKVGSSIQCIEWSNRPATPLDVATYVARDRSFAGFEYSGYSIPGLIPPEKLTQVDISPGRGGGYCALASPPVCTNDTQCAGSFTPSVCRSGRCVTASGGVSNTCFGESDCVAGTCIPNSDPPDFRLAYSYCGSRCATTTSKPCASSVDCPFVDEVVGTREACVASPNCNTASSDPNDCAATADEGDPCGLGPPAAGRGRCVNKKCLYTLTGNTIATDPAASLPGQACRAYPEQNSPFPREVLANDAENLSVRTANAPRLPGFARANVCEDGGIGCECNYQKVAYGDQSVGGTALYYSPGSLSIPQGVCQGGPRAGETCNPDAPADNFNDTDDCGPTDGGGRCAPKRRQDQVLGLKGFCLEEDPSVNVNGNRNRRNCLTWLPVDQLLGTVDLYNQHAASGFQSGELFYCPLTDEYTTIWSKAGAADVHDTLGCPEAPDVTATFLEALPKAYHDIPCRFNSDYDVVVSSTCIEVDGDVKQDWENLGSERFYSGSIGADGILGELPFVCVPKGSHHSGRLPGGQPLDSPKVGQACNLDLTVLNTETFTSVCHESSHGADDGCPTHQVTVYRVNGSIAEQNAQLKALKDCRRDGIAEPSTWLATNGGYEGDAAPNEDEERLDVLGCTYVAKAGSVAGSQPNVAWTDRVWAQKPQPYTVVGPAELSYSHQSPEAPFGRAGSPEVAPPFNFLFSPTCTTGGGVTLYPTDPNNPSACPTVEVAGTSTPSTPIAVSNDGRPYARADDGEVVDDGVGRLQQLFAKAIGIWQWFAGTETTVPSGTAEPARYRGIYTRTETQDYSDITEVGDASKQPRPPVVKSVGVCSGGRCQEGTASQITVNGQSSGDIVANGRLRVTLQFFGYADADQMPVKLVAVDWGDGTTSGSTEPINFYKNHRGFKSSGSSECDSSNFGTTPNACEDAGPFVFTHEYFPTCSGTAQVGADAHYGGTHCHYTPRVILRDNWGWCNGGCPNSPPGDPRPNGGCYGAAQCDVFSGHATRGTLYAGELIVVPAQ